jgi:hypothetical protein
MDFGKNICVGDIGRSHFNIYWQALVGAMVAETKYIALAEDDVLYCSDHFKYTPPEGIFSYNVNVASIYTWVKPPVFSFKDRRVLHSLVCERQLFVDVMKERFTKYPIGSITEIKNWAEPGKQAYEENLGVKIQKSEKFTTPVSNVVFCTPESLGFLHLGTRKRIGNRPVEEIPYWGRAEDILNNYWK